MDLEIDVATKNREAKPTLSKPDVKLNQFGLYFEILDRQC